MSNFHEILVELKEDRDISFTQIANGIGISSQRLHNWIVNIEPIYWIAACILTATVTF